jgi:hypothetical protein
LASYLYADSEPFPHSFDFLATLRAFLACGSAVLSAVSELERLENELQAGRQRADEDARAIDVFAQTMSDQIAIAVKKNPKAAAIEIVSRDMERALANAVDASKAARLGTLQAFEVQHEASATGHREAIKKAIDGFFLSADLDVLESKLMLSLGTDGYAASVGCIFPGAIDALFSLGSQRVEAWRRPRKLHDLVGEVQLQIGMKKKFLSRDLTRERIRLDDHFIQAVELEMGAARIALRKKLEGPDVLTLHLGRENGEVYGQIDRADKDVQAVFAAVPEDRGQLERLWATLEESTRHLVLQRSHVTSATMEDVPLYEPRQAVHFVETYVELFAPVVAEIAERSPSTKELSMKIEHDGGRREELYLRRDDIATLVGTLDARKMQVFAPLEIFPEIDVDFD